MFYTAIAEGVIIYNYFKLLSLLLTSFDVLVVSCPAIDPAVVDVLTAVMFLVWLVGLMLLPPVLLMTSLLLSVFPPFLASLLLFMASLLFYAIPDVNGFPVVVAIPAIVSDPTDADTDITTEV
jgi:hypothetical protein